jgi:prolyl oligopeptidase
MDLRHLALDAEEIDTERVTMSNLAYPPTRRAEILEMLHGVEVRDPYRWLEEGDSEEVRQWTEAQNALTRAALEAYPGRERLRERITALLSIGTITAPAVRQRRLFYLRRQGTQNQPLLLWRDGPAGEERVLVDPLAFDPEGTAALDWWYPSPDGRLLAFGISRNGDEKSTLYVREVETGFDRPDRVPQTRYTSLAWLPDASGFYYTRYPTPGTVPPGDENYFRKLYFHPLGADWETDPLVYAREKKEEMIGVSLSPNGRWLCVTVQEGWAKNAVYLADRWQGSGGPSSVVLVPVVEEIEALFIPEIQNDCLYLRTNHEAPNYKIMAVDPERPAREAWRELVPESEAVIDGHDVVGGHLILDLLQRASSRLRIHDLGGRLVQEVPLPTLGTLAGWGGEWDGDTLYFGFVSFTVAPTIFRYEFAGGRSELWEQVESPIDPERFEVEQTEYASRDGTRVSMFLVHRQGLPKDRKRPTLLTGYGGFNISLTPSFARAAHVLLERDGLYAMPNLRGGGEYGEAWHQAGMRERKQNVFDDFIAAGEWLVREGWTTPERLAIQGGSNGGLLVGAAVTQRPELWRAAVCAVPLLDMARYHLFSIARLWIPEYGSAEDPDQFAALYAYSPYHRVRDGERYPAMLITAAQSDTRVDPLHARKFAARVQAAQAADDRPILLRIETKAGHGAGKPLTKQIAELTDVWSFLGVEMGL